MKTAVLALVLAAALAGFSSSHAAVAKKKCHFVVKIVHGHKKRVRVCKPVKPKPRPKPLAKLKVHEGWHVSIQGGSPPGSEPPYFAIGLSSETGDIFAADTTTNRILLFDPDGTQIGVFGSTGSGPGQFNFESGNTDVGGVAIDPHSGVWVADSGNLRIQKLDASGGFIGQWPSFMTASGPARPLDIGIGSGNVYVLEDRPPHDCGVELLSAFGVFQKRFGVGTFQDPGGIGIGPEGDVYVSDFDGNSVTQFDPNGGFIRKWGKAGVKPGQLNGAAGLAIDAEGNEFGADQQNKRVVEFGPTGKPRGWWSPGGSPVEIETDRQGSFYVVTTSGVLTKFTLG
jgi:sugar lactone lactonase YvrE